MFHMFISNVFYSFRIHSIHLSSFDSCRIVTKLNVQFDSDAHAIRLRLLLKFVRAMHT